MNRGYFIVFEGGEGSGKSTQMHLLAEYLKKKGKEVYQTREPGGTALGEVIREQILLNPSIKDLNREAETFLFYASRAQLMQDIKLRLDNGAVVLLDRYYYSSIVYQGMAKEVSLSLISELNKHFPKPDIAFVLDIENIREALESAKKTSGKADRFEQEDIGFHMKIRDAYRQLTLLFPEIKLIRRSSPEKMHEEIKEHVNQLLKFS
ncbi:dTMP kinase [archaeon]|nr:dTMP kinase [archaeon]